MDDLLLAMTGFAGGRAPMPGTMPKVAGAPGFLAVFTGETGLPPVDALVGAADADGVSGVSSQHARDGREGGEHGNSLGDGNVLASEPMLPRVWPVEWLPAPEQHAGHAPMIGVAPETGVMPVTGPAPELELAAESAASGGFAVEGTGPLSAGMGERTTDAPVAAQVVQSRLAKPSQNGPARAPDVMKAPIDPDTGQGAAAPMPVSGDADSRSRLVQERDQIPAPRPSENLTLRHEPRRPPQPRMAHAEGAVHPGHRLGEGATPKGADNVVLPMVALDQAPQDNHPNIVATKERSVHRAAIERAILHPPRATMPSDPALRPEEGPEATRPAVPLVDGLPDIGVGNPAMPANGVGGLAMPARTLPPPAGDGSAGVKAAPLLAPSGLLPIRPEGAAAPSDGVDGHDPAAAPDGATGSPARAVDVVPLSEVFAPRGWPDAVERTTSGVVLVADPSSPTGSGVARGAGDAVQTHATALLRDHVTQPMMGKRGDSPPTRVPTIFSGSGIGTVTPANPGGAVQDPASSPVAPRPSSGREAMVSGPVGIGLPDGRALAVTNPVSALRDGATVPAAVLFTLPNPTPDTQGAALGGPIAPTIAPDREGGSRRAIAPGFQVPRDAAPPPPARDTIREPVVIAAPTGVRVGASDTAGTDLALDLAPAPDISGTTPGTAQAPQAIDRSAPPVFTPAPSAFPAAPVAQQIARALADPGRDTSTPLELALDPPELGRIRLSFAEVNGTLTLTIAVDRPETADLMRRHLALLSEEFFRANLDAPSVNISHGGADGNSDRRAPSAPPPTAGAEGALAHDVAAPPPPASRSPGGLDLRL